QNKFFNYLASKKPLISNREVHNILEDSGSGIVVEPEDPRALAKGILKFYEMSEKEYKIYCENAYKLAKEYDYKNLTNKLVKVLRDGNKVITIINIQEIIDLLNNHQREFVFYAEYNTMIDSFSSIYDMESNSVSWIKKGIEFDEKQLLELNDVLIITNDESLIKRKFNNINIILCENPR